MKLKFMLVLMLISICIIAMGQRPNMELTFTAVNNTSHVQLDSIKVMNRTQGGDTVLFWPDTLLSFFYVGISEVTNDNKAFRIYQNYPNPVTDQTTISLYISEKDKVILIVSNILGRVILKSERVLEQGIHSFRFTPGSGNLYFFTAWWQGQSSSIKILKSRINSGGTISLEYIGSENSSPQLKAMKDIQDFSFTHGDELLYIGYADTLQSGMLDIPEESQTYTFQFATNIPCPGTPAVEYEGQVYNTIQIFNQCWLKDNMNVGTMIEGTQGMTDNEIIEKYCYNNIEDSCIRYGGLYQWDEMMQYTTQYGVKGICPLGWHLPTNEEWKVLEGATDSQYGIGDSEWNSSGGGFLGYDAGTNLKTTSGWWENGNGTDMFDFSGLPGGYRFFDGIFWTFGSHGYWWSSTEDDSYGAWIRGLCYGYPGVYRTLDDENFGFSVRCIRDEVYIPTIELTFTAVNNTSYVEIDSIKVMNRSQGAETLIYWPDTTLVVPGDLVFTFGDELLYIGYVDTLQSGMLDSPEERTDYTFQFATNIPCPGTPAVEYEGQVYNTIQIFNQCWLKENLNVGTMIQGSEWMIDNGIMEKYCYNNEPDSCIKYGGLYQWDEMMQYTTQQGAQGMCPPGWHLPNDEEWKVLEGAVDSQYKIGDPVWDIYYDRGYNAGANLKTNSGWCENGNGTDLFGFTGLPGGARYYNGYFYDVAVYGGWWTSTVYYGNIAWFRCLYCYYSGVYRLDGFKEYGFSVRCLRNK